MNHFDDEDVLERAARAYWRGPAGKQAPQYSGKGEIEYDKKQAYAVFYNGNGLLAAWKVGDTGSIRRVPAEDIPKSILKKYG